MTDPEGPGGCLTSARGPSARRFFGLLGLKNVLGTLLGRSSFLSLMHNSVQMLQVGRRVGLVHAAGSTPTTPELLPQFKEQPPPPGTIPS